MREHAVVYGPKITFAVRVAGDADDLFKCSACPQTFRIAPDVLQEWGVLSDSVRAARDHFFTEHGTEGDVAHIRRERGEECGTSQTR